MWREGTIIINKKGDRYRIEHFDEGSQFGIDGGRISTLMIKCCGETVCNYDRCWDIKPADEDSEFAPAIIMNDYN